MGENQKKYPCALSLPRWEFLQKSGIGQYRKAGSLGKSYPFVTVEFSVLKSPKTWAFPSPDKHHDNPLSHKLGYTRHVHTSPDYCSPKTCEENMFSGMMGLLSSAVRSVNKESQYMNKIFRYWNLWDCDKLFAYAIVVRTFPFCILNFIRSERKVKASSEQESVVKV